MSPARQVAGSAWTPRAVGLPDYDALREEHAANGGGHSAPSTCDARIRPCRRSSPSSRSFGRLGRALRRRRARSSGAPLLGTLAGIGYSAMCSWRRRWFDMPLALEHLWSLAARGAVLPRVAGGCPFVVLARQCAVRDRVPSRRRHGAPGSASAAPRRGDRSRAILGLDTRSMAIVVGACSGSYGRPGARQHARARVVRFGPPLSILSRRGGVHFGGAGPRLISLGTAPRASSAEAARS